MIYMFGDICDGLLNKETGVKFITSKSLLFFYDLAIESFYHKFNVIGE
jgi:hypothetical protein